MSLGGEGIGTEYIIHRLKERAEADVNCDRNDESSRTNVARVLPCCTHHTRASRKDDVRVRECVNYEFKCKVSVLKLLR